MFVTNGIASSSVSKDVLALVVIMLHCVGNVQILVHASVPEKTLGADIRYDAIVVLSTLHSLCETLNQKFARSLIFYSPIMRTNPAVYAARLIVLFMELAGSY